MLQVQLTDAPIILGLICGGAVIYWFCGASMQAVTTGAYRAVEFIKKNLNLNKKEADIEDSKTVVKICTQYAQKGMWNIFIALMSITLAFALLNPNFFVAYLISIACFGLFQAIYMANAGGSWDNAKKVVEVDLKDKGHCSACRDRHRRHRGRSLQGYLIRVPEPDHQVLNPVRPAGNRNRDRNGGTRQGNRRHELRPYFSVPLFIIGLVFRLAFVLRHENTGSISSSTGFNTKQKPSSRNGAGAFY